MSRGTSSTDQRLIEHGFPCHQVGAETQRERDTGLAPHRQGAEDDAQDNRLRP